jgi:hypothetical protein
VLQRGHLQNFIHPQEVEFLMHSLEKVAQVEEALPEVELSSDPKDNPILATAIAGGADMLVHQQVSNDGFAGAIFVPGKEAMAGFIKVIRTVGVDAVQGRKWPRPSGLGRHGASRAGLAPIRSYGYGCSPNPPGPTRGAPNKHII